VLLEIKVRRKKCPQWIFDSAKAAAQSKDGNKWSVVCSTEKEQALIYNGSLLFSEHILW